MNTEHPARPEQTKHGWEEGQAHKRHKDSEPRFSRGQERSDSPYERAAPRFSRGQESDTPTEEKTVERRFSEGQERDSD